MKKKFLSVFLAFVLSLVFPFTNLSASAASRVTACVDYIDVSQNSLSVGGWAFSNSNKSATLKIKVEFGGRTFYANANHTRKDVDNVYHCGTRHGFGKTYTEEGLQGQFQVTVSAVDVNGQSTVIGRKTVNIPGKVDNHLPFGVVDSVSCINNNKIILNGWAMDASNYNTSLSIHCYATYNNKQVFVGSFAADEYRPDLNNAYGGNVGSYHGFADSLNLPSDATGLIKISTYAINILGGANNVLLGEKYVFVGTSNPTYSKHITQFINTPKWSNGASWAAGKRPTESTYGSSGCCAYTADYSRYMYGLNSPRSGPAFYKVSEIRAGDILYLSGPHWIVVLDRKGDQLIVAEGNWGGQVVISDNLYRISGGKIMRQKRSFSLNTGYHYL